MMTLKTNQTAMPGADALPDLDAIRGRRTPACRVTTNPCGQPPGSPGGFADPHLGIFEQLRKIQAELRAARERDWLLISRIGNIEVSIASLRLDIVQHEQVSADINVRIDQVIARLDRIERRLEPAE